VAGRCVGLFYFRPGGRKGANTLSQTIGEMSKNPYDKIVATLGEFKGRTRIDLRMYFKPEVSEADK